jgi:hypothetical protein
MRSLFTAALAIPFFQMVRLFKLPQAIIDTDIASIRNG